MNVTQLCPTNELDCNTQQFKEQSTKIFESFGLRFGSQEHCCRMLQTFQCILKQRSQGQRWAQKPLYKFFSSQHCSYYLDDAHRCSTEIEMETKFELFRLNCHNYAIKYFQSNSSIHPCCIDQFNAKCFRINYMTQCMEIANLDCMDAGSPSSSCAKIQCPPLNVLKITESFFTSYFLYVGLGLFIILFMLLFLICRQCFKIDRSINKHNNSFIHRSKTKNQGFCNRHKSFNIHVCDQIDLDNT